MALLINGSVNHPRVKNKTFTIFHALRPSFNHFIVWGSISLQLHKETGFFYYDELEYVQYGVGNCDDLYRQIIICL